MRKSGARGWRATAAVFGLAALTAGFSPMATATPILQVDIGGGYYAGPGGSTDHTSETVLTGDDVFAAYAYLAPRGNPSSDDLAALLAETYYFAVALVPKTGPVHEALGSFDVQAAATVSGGARSGESTAGGLTFAVTADMVYGTPPIESDQLHDGGDLGSAGIYETFFIELAFMFDATKQSTKINVEDDGGSGPDTGGTGMYYHAFDFDISAFAAGYDLHFDLYNTKVHSCTDGDCDIDVDDFAPHSHDGGTNRTTFTILTVPEPGTLGLMGLGLLGLGLAARRTRRR